MWQGSEPGLFPKEKLTVRAAIEEKIGARNVVFAPGTRIVRKPNSPSNNNPTNIDEEIDIPAAVAAARSVDTIILCLGEGSYTEHPGNIADLTLPEIQLKLAEALIATGKPIVLVLAEGRPRIINRIVDKVDGIVLALEPGNEGGRAVADVFFGDYNPNGKLPITYPRHPGYLPTYDTRSFESVSGSDKMFRPQFEFGHGLSYTTFAYSDLKLSSKTIGQNEKLTVSFRITNSGKLAGKETAILYLRDEVASLTPAEKRVKRFAKILLQPGESKTVTFTLSREDLQFISAANKPVVEPGEFTVMVSTLSDKFTLR